MVHIFQQRTPKDQVIKKHIPVYSPSLDLGLRTRKPIKYVDVTTPAKTAVKSYYVTQTDHLTI